MAGTASAAEAADKKDTIDIVDAVDFVNLGLGGHIGRGGPWTWSRAWVYGIVYCSHIESNNTSIFLTTTGMKMTFSTII